MLLDIQAIIAKGKGPGYERWAKVHNIKQMAQTLLFLEEHDLRDYEELAQKAKTASDRFGEITEKQKLLEARLVEIAALKKHIINYSKTKDVYADYRKSGYSKKFYAEHEAELLIYKAAEEVYKNAPGRKIPPMQELQDEYGRILAEKKAEFLEYAQIKKDMNEYLIAKKNLELLYQQEEEKKEREGRDKRTRNSHQKDVL
jgi:hypothetical protein